MKIDEIIQSFQAFSLSTFARLLRVIGIRNTYKGAKILAFIAWKFNSERRELAIRNIEKHLNLSQEEATRIAYESFKNNFMSFADIVFTHHVGLDHDTLPIELPEQSILEEFKNCQRPLIGITAHLGTWEFLAPLMGNIFPSPRELCIVVRKYPNKAIYEFIKKQREVNGAKMVGHRTASTEVLRALRKNGVIGILADHKPRRSEAIYVPFLGEETAVNIGPALLGLRAEATFYPIFMVRTEKGLKVVLGTPFDSQGFQGTRQEKVEFVAKYYSQEIEKQIRAYPEQWFWMHDRWSNPV